MASVSSWLPFIRASAVGWIPVAQSAVPQPYVLNDNVLQADYKIRINVSGQRFETWKHTLNKYPNTLLGSDEKVDLYLNKSIVMQYYLKLSCSHNLMFLIYIVNNIFA